MASMMQTMHDPTYRTKLEAKMSSMKDDPELAKILEEMESGGPAAMMKCVFCFRPIMCNLPLSKARQFNYDACLLSNL